MQNINKTSNTTSETLLLSIFTVPLLFAIGLIVSLWNGLWIAKILELGTAHFGWRSFSTCEVLIAALAFGIVHKNSVDKDKTPFEIFIGWLFGPIFAYLLALAVVGIFT